MYLLLYIPINYEEQEVYPWEINKEEMRQSLLLHKALTNTIWGKYKTQLDMSHIWNKCQYMSCIRQTFVEHKKLL